MYAEAANEHSELKEKLVKSSRDSTRFAEMSKNYGQVINAHNKLVEELKEVKSVGKSY